MARKGRGKYWKANARWEGHGGSSETSGGTPPTSQAMDFSDATNSMYVALLEDI